MMKKLLAVLLIAIPLVVVAALIILFVSLNSIVKTAVEKVGSKATGTEVVLADVDLSPLSGKGQLQGLSVGNPAGFKTETAFQLGNVRVELDPRSLLSDTIVVREVLIDAPEITYEQGIPRSNIQVIKNNVAAFAGPPSEEEPEAAEEPAKPGKQVVIEHLLITNGKVRVSSTLAQGKAVTIKLPKVELKNLGSTSEERSVAEVLNTVIAAVSEAVISSVGNAGDLLEGSKEKLRESAEQLTGKGTEARQAIEEKSGKLAEGIKGLFGGDKD
jgi:uncharacterized protein involved in outer membrane biogenesis